MSRSRSIRVRRIVLVAVLAAAVCAGASSAARSALAASLCVGAKPGCFSTVQAAVNAAQDGNTIEIGPGTFEGGIVIDKSVQLVGASAAATTIAGGGPVVTIGSFEGNNEDMTVGLSRLTITGGLNDSQPSTSIVAGGGIWIPGSFGNAAGATISIDDSVIIANRVTPQTTIPPGGFSCRSAYAHPCAFANGGGIDNSGALTLTNTRVSDNVAGAAPGGSSLASDASGGGIDNHPQGTLIMQHSFVTGNRAAVNPPNGAFSEAGGVLDGGAMVIEDGAIDENASVVVSSVPSVFPFDVEQVADAGGLDVAGGATATISRSTISRNTVSGFDSNGDVQAINGGIDGDGSLLLTDSSVDRNNVTAEVPAASGFLADAVSGGLHVGGAATVRSSRISDNNLTAVSATGTANVAGAGIGNLSGQLTLEKTSVTGNRGAATGVGGLVLGGGILNVAFGGGPPELALTDSVVTANSLTATGPGFEPQGGGIFSADLFGGGAFPVSVSNTVIEGNKPDQCVGGC
jgi:hypothetical protein